MDEFNNWDKIADAFEAEVDKVITTSASHVKTGFQARVHVRTGFLRDSAYEVTSSTSTHGQCPQSPHLMREVARPDDKHTTIVAIGADYGVIEEMGGTHHPAHPSLMPAVEAERPAFDAGLDAIEQKLGSVK